MATVDVDTTGLDRVARRLSSTFRSARKKAMEAGVEYAVRHCRVGEGGPSGDVHLFETIRVVGVNQNADDLVAGDLSKDVGHAPPNEYGTHKMGAQPFVRPAAKEMERVLNAELARLLR